MKNRRSFLKKLAAGTMAAGLLPISKKADAGEVKITNALVHHVFFWLKEPKNDSAKQQLLKALNELLKVETIKMSHIGFPAGTESRDVVDTPILFPLCCFSTIRQDRMPIRFTRFM